MRRLPAGDRQLRQVIADDFDQALGRVEQPAPGSRARGPAYEHGVDDGRSRAVNVNRAAHLGRARQRRRTNKTGIQERHADRAIGVELVVMIREHQRRSGLQGPDHSGVDCGQSFRKLLQTAVLGDIPCQLVRRPRGRPVETLSSLPARRSSQT